MLDDPSCLGEFGNSAAVQGVSPQTVERWEQEALALARESDILVLAMGEHVMQSGEGGSRTDIRLPACQRSLLKALHAIGKPIVLVLFSGRPLVLTDVEPDCDAILQAWFPGTAGGEAVCRLLFGDAEPTGRLSMAFPRSVGQLPLYYNHFNTGRPQGSPALPPRFTSHYLDCDNAPLYPFGYGLGYHRAEYGALSLDKAVMRRGETITASLAVTNVSTRPGTETVQWYIRDMAASVVRPVKELKGFEQVKLAPGECRAVHFTITETELQFCGRDMRPACEPGGFLLMAGPNSRYLQCAHFVLAE